MIMKERAEQYQKMQVVSICVCVCAINYVITNFVIAKHKN